MSDLVYLYGFAPSDAPPPPEDLTGIAGRPVEAFPLDGFVAVVSHVPAREYAPEAVEASMHDLGWVGDQGALHERVVTWYVDHAHIVPVRLLTLYSGNAALRAEAEAQAATVRQRLEATRGLREWDLKVSYRADALRGHLGELSEEIAALDQELAEADPGRRYLLERKREKRLSEETRSAARRLGQQVLELARPFAREVRQLQPPRTGGELPVVVAAALLVPREADGSLEDAVAAEAERLERLGVSVRLSGPWAPYRFLEPAAVSDA